MDRHLLIALVSAAALAAVPGRAAAQDTTPPGTITDLSLEWVDGLDYDGDGFPDYYTANLTWTSPGDDAFVAGTSVTTYHFRGLDSPISAGNWANTSTLAPVGFTIVPAPQVAMAHMEYSWPPGATYYFAIMAVDDSSNPGQITQVGSMPPPTPESSKGGKGPCQNAAAGSFAFLALLAPLAMLRR